MPFLTEVHFQNYRSFLDAQCRLSPVTVVIGANNAGKSNFLKGIVTAAGDKFGMVSLAELRQHRNLEESLAPSRISLYSLLGKTIWTEQWNSPRSSGHRKGRFKGWRS